MGRWLEFIIRELSAGRVEALAGSECFVPCAVVNIEREFVKVIKYLGNHISYRVCMKSCLEPYIG